VCVHCPQRVGLLSCWLFQIGLYIALFSPSCYPWYDTGIRCVSVVDCFSSHNRYCSGWQHYGEHFEYGCKQVRIFQCIDTNYWYFSSFWRCLISWFTAMTHHPTNLSIVNNHCVNWLYIVCLSSCVQFALVCVLEVFLRLTPLMNLGETAGPVIMFMIPVVFYIVLAAQGISFQEVKMSILPTMAITCPPIIWKYISGINVLYCVLYSMHSSHQRLIYNRTTASTLTGCWPTLPHVHTLIGPRRQLAFSCGPGVPWMGHVGILHLKRCRGHPLGCGVDAISHHPFFGCLHTCLGAYSHTHFVHDNRFAHAVLFCFVCYCPTLCCD
jgi:hypothetical protein